MLALERVANLLAAGASHRGQAIGEHGARIVTIWRSPSLDPASLRHAIERRRRNTQSFEQRAVAQSAVLARQNRHLMECVDSDSLAVLPSAVLGLLPSILYWVGRASAISLGSPLLARENSLNGSSSSFLSPAWRGLSDLEALE